MTQIKLCGLSRTVDILTVNQLMPDYIGFIFAPRSRRYVDPDQALVLKRLLDPKIKAVGVFVNESPDLIADLVSRGIIDVVQLHGKEDQTYIDSLKTRINVPVIKAFKLEKPEDLEQVRCCKADYVLLDAGEGGTGTVFDWSLIGALERPYFLAGGLNLRNIESAVKMLHPFAVDVSSGIETDGLKDPEKMKEFVEKVRKGQKL